MPKSPSQPGGLLNKELKSAHSVRRSQLVHSARNQRGPWSLLADAGLHLQVASAATKAAVSSLLDRNIVWDASNQYEFLQTIDASTDQVDRIIRLLTLAFQLQAGRIELRPEPNVLPEIVAGVAHRAHLRPRPPLDLRLSSGGRPVLADDEYLTLALELLLELLDGHLARSPLRVRLVEESTSWQIVLTGLKTVTAALVVAQLAQPINEPVTAATLTVENQLRLLVVCGLLKLQGAEAWVSAEDSNELNLRLPAVVRPGSAEN